MKTTLINRLKNGLPFGLLFIAVSIYFYVKDAYDLAAVAASIGIILFLGYTLYKLKFKKGK